MSSRLEWVYLMNVAMYLNTKMAISNFLFVNKKCQNAFKYLKRSPVFVEHITYMWYISHFSPNTINLGNARLPVSCIPDNIKIWRYPNFMYDFSIGDVEVVAVFLTYYTYNGQNKYNRLKKITVQSRVNTNEGVFENTFKCFDTIRLCIDRNKTVVHALVISYNDTKDFVKLIEQFREIKFYNAYIACDGIFENNNVFVAQKGRISIYGLPRENITTILNKTATTAVYHIYAEGVKEVWSLPESVKEYTLSMTFYNKYYYQFNADTTYLKKLKITNNVNNVVFINVFLFLEILEIEESKNILFGVDSIFVVLEELYIKWSNRIKIKSTFVNKSVKLSSFILSSKVTVLNSMLNESHTVNVWGCEDVKLHEEINTLNIYVEISNCIEVRNKTYTGIIGKNDYISMPDNKIFFEMNDFISLFSELLIQRNHFVIREHDNNDYLIAISRNFMDELCQLPVQYIYKNELFEVFGVRYFEVRAGYGWYNIGVLDQKNYETSKNWDTEFSIEFYCGDGFVYSQYLINKKIETETFKDVTHSNEIGKVNVFGCGIVKQQYNKKLVFFTVNGKIHSQFIVEIEVFDAIVCIRQAESFDIIYPFEDGYTFDLKQIIKN
ncbi:hypothetical protein EIN_076130 [Entamoeba invadens IP1]|uniref:SPRY domain-containing protein n=1 Tax=Entamoeba invadens IP1 TaxID=370355 RepID=A0A0A1U1K8_ENTIV|nr:hypothetical protein EIN_076130 [Entamoeba invadens IP1]ELP84794.1 hypothetical protein EIN_076130 [Entamoeba invadens IP1]|eukprot:XP_004184140.1 hypothetical protein EIN_076130 [Entamoeba invadens IP1]